MDPAARARVDSALERASEELGLATYYRDCVRPLLAQPRERYARQRRANRYRHVELDRVQRDRVRHVLALDELRNQRRIRGSAKRLRKAEVDLSKLEAKLSNSQFAANAPPDIVAKDQQRLEELRTEIGQLSAQTARVRKLKDQ